LQVVEAAVLIEVLLVAALVVIVLLCLVNHPVEVHLLKAPQRLLLELLIPLLLVLVVLLLIFILGISRLPQVLILFLEE
jgi:hypothetical protein